MHTFDGKSCIIHHNSDLSGDVHILPKAGGPEVRVKGRDLLEFVAEYLRSEKISALEQASVEQILGIEGGA